MLVEASSRRFRAAPILAAIVMAGLPVRAPAAQPEGAIARMLEPGPEARELASRAGAWDVTITIRPAPGAEPIVSKGLARRRMVGLFLEEVIGPVPGSGEPDFSRISYMTYSRVEGRWQYVSLDTRFPAGIMPAYSAGKEENGRLTLLFEPLAFAGWGAEVDGWFLRSDYVIERSGDTAETARQYWTRADGTERRWLAVEYAYRRR